MNYIKKTREDFEKEIGVSRIKKLLKVEDKDPLGLKEVMK